MLNCYYVYEILYTEMLHTTKVLSVSYLCHYLQIGKWESLPDTVFKCEFIFSVLIKIIVAYNLINLGGVVTGIVQAIFKWKIFLSSSSSTQALCVPLSSYSGSHPSTDLRSTYWYPRSKYCEVSSDNGIRCIIQQVQQFNQFTSHFVTFYYWDF